MAKRKKAKKGREPRPEVDNFIAVDHPLVQHKLTLLRNHITPSKDFRELLEEISMLLAYEVTKELSGGMVPVKTPLMRTLGVQIYEEQVTAVAILRAGLGMLSGIQKLIPPVRTGMVGIYRDPKTLKAVQYYQKFPKDMDKGLVVLCDPMLATGHSAVKALNIIKEEGATKIVMMALIAAPEGVREVETHHPDVKIYAAAQDDRLNSHGYILPGLGDAGDRLFGTV